MIRDVLAIETGDLVFPIIIEVATSREYHAARKLYGARFKHISLAISDIDTKFYLISTIFRYISIIIRIPETSPHDVNPRHSRFSVLQLKFSKGRQKIWYILVINLQSYFGELWHIIPNKKALVGIVEGTMIGAGEHCFRAACDLGLIPVFFSTDPDRYTFLPRYDCIVVRVQSIGVATLSDQMRLVEYETQGAFVGMGTTDDAALAAVREISIKRGFACVPESGLQNCRNKAITRELLRHQSPRFERVGPESNLEKALESFQSDVIVKPVDQSSGLGVKRCGSRLESKRHIRSLFSNTSGKDHVSTSQVLIEEFLDGQEVSVEVFNGRALGVTQIEIDDKLGFVEVCHLYPANLPSSIIAQLKVMAEEAVVITGIT